MIFALAIRGDIAYLHSSRSLEVTMAQSKVFTHKEIDDQIIRMARSKPGGRFRSADVNATLRDNGMMSGSRVTVATAAVRRLIKDDIAKRLQIALFELTEKGRKVAVERLTESEKVST